MTKPNILDREQLIKRREVLEQALENIVSSLEDPSFVTDADLVAIRQSAKAVLEGNAPEKDDLEGPKTEKWETDFLPKDWVSLGVGDGTSRHFVHGPYESIKVLQQKLLEENNGPNIT